MLRGCADSAREGVRGSRGWRKLHQMLMRLSICYCNKESMCDRVC